MCESTDQLWGMERARTSEAGGRVVLKTGATGSVTEGARAATGLLVCTSRSAMTLPWPSSTATLKQRPHPTCARHRGGAGVVRRATDAAVGGALSAAGGAGRRAPHLVRGGDEIVDVGQHRGWVVQLGEVDHVL